MFLQKLLTKLNMSGPGTAVGGLEDTRQLLAGLDAVPALLTRAGATLQLALPDLLPRALHQATLWLPAVWLQRATRLAGRRLITHRPGRLLPSPAPGWLAVNLTRPVRRKLQRGGRVLEITRLRPDDANLYAFLQLVPKVSACSVCRAP